MNSKEQKPDKMSTESASGKEDFGSGSQQGATSTNPDKQRLQTVEANDAAKEAASDGPARITDVPPGNAPEDVDQGSIRTAAFSEGKEPRSEESLENRGITQGSDDTSR